MKPFLILLLVLLLLLPGVLGLTCTYDENPVLYLTTTPAAYCTSDNLSLSTNCYTYLSYSGDSFGLMPPRADVENYGVVQGYAMTNGQVVVQFARIGLHDGKAVNATVLCGAENVTFAFTPSLLDYEEITDREIWLQAHTRDLWWGVFGFIFIVIIITAFIWALKK